MDGGGNSRIQNILSRLPTFDAVTIIFKILKLIYIKFVETRRHRLFDSKTSH